MNNTITDQFERPLRDLRISVIDRCNFRCPYCMPEEEFHKHYSFLKQNQWLSADELTKLVHAFVHLGVRKLRITGGEPLLRPDIITIVRQFAQIPNLEDLALTTNGSLLTQFLKDLKDAGLKRLTISLDTLDSRTFKLMSGNKGDVKSVLSGIDQAIAEGFTDIKINVVVQKGVNDHTILDLVKYFKIRPVTLRFIEYMDVGNCNHWDQKYVVPSVEIKKLIEKHYPMKPLKPDYFGEVASRYQFTDLSGEIGFISSVSQPFCGSCTRARLSADGQLYTCLFAKEGKVLKTILQKNPSEEELSDHITHIWNQREDRYSELRQNLKTSHQNPSKVEMFQIGG